MSFLRKELEVSPIRARVIPFVTFLVLTFFQGEGDSRYLLYFIKTLVGLWCIREMRPLVPEMRWALSWEAVLVGVGVCVMWVGIDGLYPKFGRPGPAWNPHQTFGQNSPTAWAVILIRLFGSTFIVPPLEEVFYRSFLYRYFVKLDFQSMPFSRFHPLSFVVTAVIFGPGQHYQWLAGILCGMAFQWLVIRKDRLGDAMTAHAITNFLLGLWVIKTGSWSFW